LDLPKLRYPNYLAENFIFEENFNFDLVKNPKIDKDEFQSTKDEEEKEDYSYARERKYTMKIK